MTYPLRRILSRHCGYGLLCRDWANGPRKCIVVSDELSKTFSTLENTRIHPQKGHFLLRNDNTRGSRHNGLISNSIARYSSNEQVTWLWKVEDGLKTFVKANHHGTVTINLMLTFNSVRPLTLEHFEQAFDHLTRQVPNMRAAVRIKDDSFWFCEPHDVKPDIKKLPDGVNFEQHCIAMLNEGIHETAPLPWKVRIKESEPSDPCYVEGIKERYPYQYDFSLLISHAIAEGNDTPIVINTLLENLNKILGGEKISEHQRGVFGKNTDLQLLLSQHREALLNDSSKIESIKKTLTIPGESPTILRAFPRPKVSKVGTNHLRRIIDTQLMKELLAKCVEKGVTFNSLCTAVVNITIVELLKEMGFKDESYNIASNILVNARRYNKTLKKHLLGCHVVRLIYLSQVNTNMSDDFWRYCKTVNDELQQYYTEGGRTLDQVVVQAMIDKESPPSNFTDNPVPVSHDYGITGTGDISKYVPGKGEHVQITNLSILINVHNHVHGLMFATQTFRGRIQYDLHYANNYFSDETANLIADKMFHIFNLVRK